jgi:hypothetical protein
LEVVKAQVMSSPTLLADFDATVNLFKDFLSQRKSSGSNGNADGQIAGVSTRNNNQKGDGKYNKRDKKRGASATTAGVDVQERYYSAKEYAELSQEQKKALHDLRQKRRRKDGSTSIPDSQIQAVATKVTEMVIASMNTGNETTDDDKTQKVDNRTNSALVRQKK